MPTISLLIRCALAVAVALLCALPGPPAASAATPVTTASETWIGEVHNEDRICCKAASTMPVRATIRVRRVDGSGARTLVSCARGHAARLALRGSTAVFTAECPDQPSGRILVADLDAGGPPRVLTTAPAPLSALAASEAHVAYATAGGGGTVEVLDRATGAPVRSVVLEPGFALAGVLDDGTLVVVDGRAFDCTAEVALIAPDGGRAVAGAACGPPVAVGSRIAYARATVEAGVLEVVVRDTAGGTQPLGRLRPTGAPVDLAFDGRRVAWTEDRCSDGARTVTVEIDAGAPPIAPGPARCPWSVAPQAAVTSAGRLALVVRCPLGCADLFHVTSRRRTVALRRAVVAPGEHVVELRIGGWARRALRRHGRLGARVTLDRQAGAERVTIVAAGREPGRPRDRERGRSPNGDQFRR